MLISGTISFSLLTHGHVWGDDFASYIMQAKSIVNGNMDEFIRRNAFTINESSAPQGPVAYPWGFPLLLAPVFAIFGMKLIALKAVNIVFYVLFLIALFKLARTRLTDLESLIITALFAFNLNLLEAHDIIGSDISFLFFSTLGIFLVDKFCRQKPSWWDNVLIGAVVFIAYFIRTNGILLVVTLAMVHFIRLLSLRRNKSELLREMKPAAIPYLIFGILFICTSLVFPNGETSYISHFSMFTLPHLWDNVLFYLWLIPEMFRDIPGGVLVYPFLLPFVGISFFASFRRDWPLHTYNLLTLALFIIWPERQGLRFIYPVLPFFFISAMLGMKWVAFHLKLEWQRAASAVLYTLWGALTLVSLAASVQFGWNSFVNNREINGPFDPVSTEMFSFVREKTPSDSVIIFYRPRALRLLTDHDAFMTEDCSYFTKGDYLVISKKVNDVRQVSPDQVTTCNPLVKLEEVFDNRRFTAYKINK